MVLSTLKNNDPFFQALALKQAFKGLMTDDKIVTEASKASVGLETKSHLEAARALKKHIPKHSQSMETQDKYYQSLVQRAGSLEVAIEDALSVNEEAITKMTLIYKNVEALYNLLDGYKGRSYQQIFDPEKFKPVFQKIDSAIESLQTFQQKWTRSSEELKKRFVEGDELIQYSGPELQEEKLQKYLEISQNEKASQKHWNDLTLKLREKSREIKDREQRKLEAEQKVKYLEARIIELKTLCQQRRTEIIEAKNELTIYENRREELRIKANNSYVESVNKTTKDKEEQYKKVKVSFNNRIDHIDEMIEDLTKKLGSYAAMHTSYHYIFLLDHSGSMMGPRWEALIRALNLFVEKNKSKALDLLSVITFDDSAEEHMKKMKFSEYNPPVSSKWGGTNFDAGFTMARDFANLSRSHCPVVIFLTDGHGFMENTPSLLREMSSAHKQKGFMMFSVGVGDGFNVDSLKEITKTANDGNFFIDLGGERIELLLTTKNEQVLDKIFGEIYAAVYGLPLKLRKALDTLKQEKETVGKEAEQTVEVYNKLSEEELNDMDLKQKEILDRQMKTVEEKEISHKERIEFLGKEVEDIVLEIQNLEKEITDENNSFTQNEIDTLKQEQEHLEGQRTAVYSEVQKFSEERTIALNEAQTKKKEMNFSTTLQLFDFYKAKDNFDIAYTETRINLGRVKNWIGFIIEESSAIKESLKSADFRENELVREGAFDIVVDFYKDLLELEKGCDISNIKKIACKILEIQESQTEKKDRLDRLFTYLSARQLADPLAKEDDHQNKIRHGVKKDTEYRVDLLEEEVEQCKKEKLKKEENITKFKKSADRAQEDLVSIEREIEKQEREVRKLKKKVKAKEKDTDDKENKRKENIDSDDSDEDDPTELLQKAQISLSSKQKKRDELEQNISELTTQRRLLEDSLDDIERRITAQERKLSESEKERKKLTQELEQDYSILRQDLIPKIIKKMSDYRTEQLETFKQNLFNNLIQPLQSYFSNIRDPTVLEGKTLDSNIPALDI